MEQMKTFSFTNKDRADRIKKMIGEDMGFGRPADILADLMHYCKAYPDIEDSEIFHDFEYELDIARGYFEEELWKLIKIN